MHPFFGVAALLAPICAALNIQVNYYTDGGCTAFLASIHPSTNDDCYGYQYSGTNSANIANCDAKYGCTCTFYTNDGCTGATRTVANPGNNCASDWGVGFKSMRCAKLA